MLLRLPRTTAVLATILSATAAVAAGPSPTAVLGFEAIDVPETVATDVTDAVKARVAASQAFTVVAGKDLMEVKLVFSCPDETPACMAQAGKSLGATKLVYGNVRKSGSETVVNIRLLDVNRGAVEGVLTDTLPRRAGRATIDQAAQRWIAKLTGAPTSTVASTGSIRIVSSAPGTTVFVDDVRAGVAGPSGLVLQDVSPGRHDVRLEKVGFAPAHREVSVSAGQETAASVTLATDVPARSGVDAETGAEPETVTPRTGGERPNGVRRALRNAFWISLGLGVATGVVATKFGLDVRQVNEDLDPLRRFPCSGNASQVCDLSGNPASELTDSQQQYVTQKRADGDQAEKLEWTFLIATGALGVAAAATGIAYLVYKGDSGERSGSSSASSSSLTVVPHVNASGGGLTALIEF